MRSRLLGLRRGLAPEKRLEAEADVKTARDVGLLPYTATNVEASDGATVDVVYGPLDALGTEAHQAWLRLKSADAQERAEGVNRRMRSPSRVMFGLGGYTAMGFALGISSNAGLAADAGTTWRWIPSGRGKPRWLVPGRFPPLRRWGPSAWGPLLADRSRSASVTSSSMHRVATPMRLRKPQLEQSDARSSRSSPAWTTRDDGPGIRRTRPAAAHCFLVEIGEHVPEPARDLCPLLRRQPCDANRHRSAFGGTRQPALLEQLEPQITKGSDPIATTKKVGRSENRGTALPASADDPASERLLKVAAPNTPGRSSRYQKPLAVSGHQGDEASDLQECRNKLELTSDKIVIACDQLGEAIAAAHANGDCDAIGNHLLPMLLNLWELRWESFVDAGGISAEPTVRRVVACYPDEDAASEAVQ